jgi:hypothetical protein
MAVIWAQEPAFDGGGRDDMFCYLRHCFGSTLRLESPRYDVEPDELDFSAELDFTPDRSDLDNGAPEFLYRYPMYHKKGRRPRAAAWFKAMREEHPDISPELLQELYREFRDHVFGVRRLSYG